MSLYCSYVKCSPTCGPIASPHTHLHIHYYLQSCHCRRQHALSFFSSVMADNNPPPLSHRSSLCSLCRGERLLRRRSIQAAEAIRSLSRKMFVFSSSSWRPLAAGATSTSARIGVGGFATVGVMRQRRGPDGRSDEGGDVCPPVVPGDNLDCPTIQVAAIFVPCPVVVPREHPAINAPACHRGVNGVRLRLILQGGGQIIIRR